MAFIHAFPYTDFHELNLDWVIKQIESIANASGITFDDTTAQINADNVQTAIENIKTLLDNYATQASNFVLVSNAIPETYWENGHTYTHLQTVNDATLTAIIDAIKNEKYVVLTRETTDGTNNFTDFFVLTEIINAPADYKHTLIFKSVLTHKECSLVINGLTDVENIYVDLLADAVKTIVEKFNNRSGNVSPESGDYSADQITYDNSGSSLSATDAQGAIDEVKTITDGKQGTLSFDATPTLGSDNPVTSNGIKTALNAKQDTLSFDATPTPGSSNPVTSDGIANAIQQSVTGVVEWNSRSGYVSPQAGDYDASQIDFDPSTTSLSPNATTVQKAIEELAPAQITVTLTLNGAKEDSITIYDSNNTQVGSCIFASGQTSGTAQIIVPVGGGSYKFVSSVAKNTTDASTDYEKTVTLTDTATQTVNIYPDKALYWYGNKVACDYVKVGSSAITHGETSDITDNTNSVTMNSVYVGDGSLGIMSTSKYSSGTLKGYASQNATTYGQTILNLYPNYNDKTGNTELAYWPSNTTYTDQIISANFSSEAYVCIRIYLGVSEFKAFWID